MVFTGIIRNWSEDAVYRCIWGTLFTEGDPLGKGFHTSRVKELNRSAGYVSDWTGGIYKLEEEKVDA